MTWQAKPYLEKAMKLDPTYLDAVYIMADICAQEHDHDRGITLSVHFCCSYLSLFIQWHGCSFL